MQTFSSPDNPDPFVGRVLLRDLRLVERLGATAEGPLYRGQYSAGGPPVAVTVLRVPSDSGHSPAAASLSDSHWQELQRACQIQHPNVATLLDVGETSDGIVYAVGELLTGELVSDILAVSGGIPAPQAVDICLQVAEGLRAAHAAGVVHGNVSPQTVLVTGGGERLAVKLIRFDFTRHTREHGDPRTATRWADDQPDPTEDIVGVGILLHCLLTGVPPDGERRTRAIPAPLHRIIDRCLGGHGRPYPTVAALADDLARQAGAAARRRGVPLRPAALAAGAALLAGGVWFGWTRIRGDSAEGRNEVSTGAFEAAADSQPPPAGNAVVRRPDSVPAPARPRPAPAARRADSSARTAAVPTAARDTAATLSPFRRSHPWAAEPGGHVYFPSSCQQALHATDLLYFRTEAEARATGRTRSPDPRCS